MKLKNIALLIITVLIISLFPVASYAAVDDPYSLIDAKQYDFSSNDALFPKSTLSMAMGGRNFVDYICFKDVDFGEKIPYAVAVKIAIDALHSGVGNVFEFKVDSPDSEPIATVEITNIGGWGVFTENVGKVTTEISGKHDVYIYSNKPNDFQSFYFIGRNAGDVIYKPYSKYTVFNDMSGHALETEVNTLYNLGIMGAYEKNNFLPELPITRAEFAQYLANLMIDEVPASYEEKFTDVSYDNEYYNAINYLCDSGIVKLNDTKTFNPLSFITVRDAAVMVLRVLGYEQLCMYYGGYPQGYMRLANSVGILQGLDFNSYLRREGAAKMLYAALDAEYMTVGGVENGSAIYDKKTGILELTRNIYKGKGTVNATIFGGITQNIEVIGGSCYIGDKVFKTGNISLEHYLGVNCEYFYKHSNNENTLISVIPLNNVKQEVINTSDYKFSKLTSTSIEYRNEKDKLVTKKIPVSATWIYNNRPLTRDISDVVTASELKGSIRLVDNGNGIEIVFVDNYTNIKVRSYDGVKKVLYDELSDKEISFQNADVFLSDGTSIVAANAIGKGQLAELYYSDDKKIVAILVGESVVSGTVDEINSDGKVRIGDVLYTKSSELKDSIILGQMSNFYLNRHGEIVYIETEAEEKMLGVLFDMEMTSDDGVIFSLATKTDVLNEFKAADKIYIDGIRYEGYNEISGVVTSSLRYKPVLYSLDKSGKITMLDTENDGALNEKDTLTLMHPMDTTGYDYIKWTGNFSNSSTFALDRPVEDDTLVILLTEKGKQSGKCYMEEITSYSSFYNHPFAFYSTKRDPIIADLVYNGSYVNHNVKDYEFVDRISTALGRDGETVGVNIHFLTPTGETIYWVSSENTSCYKQAKALKHGDFAWLDIALDGTVDRIAVAAFFDGNSSNLAGQTATVSIEKGISDTGRLDGSNMKLIYGTVNSVKGDFIEVIPYSSTTSVWCKASGDIVVKVSPEKIKFKQSTALILPGDKVMVRYQSGLRWIALYE